MVMQEAPQSKEDMLFREIAGNWLRCIKQAEDHKHDVFGKDAEECAKFFDGPVNWMWQEKFVGDGERGFLRQNSGALMPMFRMTAGNKPFEAVAIFGPALLHRYPNVMVTPVNPPEVPPEALGLNMQDQYHVQYAQQMQQQEQYTNNMRSVVASLKEHYLNWLQVESDKKTESRKSINEAVVVGAGYLYTEIYSPRGSQIRYPRSIHVSWKDVVKDHDAEYDRDVMWIAVRRREPVNLVERKFGLKPGAIHGTHQSASSQASMEGEREAKSNKKHGKSFDVVEYWEVFSKNGIGNRLHMKTAKESEYEDIYEQFGDFCYLAVAKGVQFPLNLPPNSKQAQPQRFTDVNQLFDDLFRRAQWPIPYYGDDGKGWPISELGFYDKLNCTYPLGMFKPVLGELRFINWAMSFLADKVASSATDYLAMNKSIAKDIEEQLSGNNLTPYQILKIGDAADIPIERLVAFIKAPQFSPDIYNVVEAVMDVIDKRTGLTELVYGLTSRQIRSATEANVREQNLNVRPDDMAQKVEDWYSEAARKEMMALCWLMQGKDVFPVLGQQGAQVWDQYVLQQPYESVIREYNYRVEAGSGRKPNKQSRIQSLNEFAQMAMQALSQFAAQGQVGPFNAYMTEYAKAMDMDATDFLLPEPPPPEEQGPSPDEIKAQMEQQKHQMEMQKLQIEGQMKQMEAGLKSQLAQMDQRKAMAEFQTFITKAIAELKQDEEVHEQEMEQAKEKAALDLKIQKKKASAQAAQAKAKSKVSKDSQ